MPPPSQIAIATSSVQRLVKEELSYHKELVSQEARLEKLLKSEGDEDGNKEFQVKQEKTAIEETRAVFPPLRQRITDAVLKLEDQLEAGTASEAETEKAKAAIESAKEAGGEK
ncbi:Tubulin-specific chaperone A [Lachnellula cervina]|uniref:Tubulin-specific chaperone A n=1 Tax=Lachnellula cervina TaxID=1316786 RepID=A0A7D8UKN4_9HELO|nr:Tubulin-specific chaperone A [Lachnellula cervina]